MPLEKLLNASEIRETRESKGLKISTVDELIGVLDMGFMKKVTTAVNALSDTKKSNAEMQLQSPLTKGVKSKGKKEGQCEYIENKDPTLDIIVNSLKEKGFKVIFYQKKHRVDDWDDGYRAMGIYMSVSL